MQTIKNILEKTDMGFDEYEMTNTILFLSGENRTEVEILLAYLIGKSFNNGVNHTRKIIHQDLAKIISK